MVNRDDLEVLVRVHQAEIYRYLRFLGAEDTAVAEDLVQDTFLAAFQSPNPPDSADVRRQSAWLRGIARNLFLMHCRRKRKSPVQVDSEYLERAEAFWTTEFLRGGDGFDYVQSLRSCLEKLAEKPRRLLELFYTQEKSRAEIAQLFGVTEDGIKLSLRRVRAGLADCIQRRLTLGEDSMNHERHL